MRIFLFLTAFLFCFPVISSAQELNAGFVQGLWYSQEDIFVGDTVRIYAALRNNTEHDLTATIHFTDNAERIATKAVSALPGRLVESWADWTPEYGEHTLTAVLTDIKIHVIGEKAEAADVISMLAEDVLVIDYDTDNDGTGNEADDDDDGDGVSDEDELENNTDPLVFNEPVTAISDDGADTSAAENEMASEAEDSSASTAVDEGFERFTDEGTIDTVLTSITDTVADAKRSLDGYRNERSMKREKQNGALEANDLAEEASGTLQEEKATITRHKIEEDSPGIFSALLGGIVYMLEGFYTLILFLLSKILAHPALIQVLLLLGILFAIYKITQRLGRRQFD